jgi:hypothetical protein
MSITRAVGNSRALVIFQQSTDSFIRCGGRRDVQGVDPDIRPAIVCKGMSFGHARPYAAGLGFKIRQEQL